MINLSILTNAFEQINLYKEFILPILIILMPVLVTLLICSPGLKFVIDILKNNWQNKIICLLNTLRNKLSQVTNRGGCHRNPSYLLHSITHF